MKIVRACVLGLHWKLVLIGKELRKRGKKEGEKRGNKTSFGSITNNFRHNVQLYS